MRYGMFTEAGNAAVDEIVTMALERNYSYANLDKELFKLSKIECFAEATDTAVRECAYIALREGLVR